MFHCGKEEPLTNNEFLYQRKKNENTLFLDHSAGISINRYTFIHKSGAPNMEIPLLFRTLLTQLDMKAFSVLSWLAQIPNKSKIASRVIEKRYEKKGWAIKVKNDRYLAIREFHYDEIIEWPPLGINPLDCGFLFMIGNCNEVEILKSISDDDSVFLSQGINFVPDINFLLNLEKTGISVCYEAEDELNNVALVLVGKTKLDISNISKKNYISCIYDGGKAYKAFM